ncbi:DUF2092 domain-containing protein [Microvirga massiliensis]|uniref:DUF2092 domain-containing protein n=1 Tax=Microvirga massiliensis TaxID=1033741 RepID=UPI00062B700D|nr:DUF2092 domain-containing protein [Microvirga massiliensis]
MTQHLPTRAQAVRGIGVGVIAAVLLSVTTMVAKADDGDARKVLKAMTDFMARQKTLSATYDTDIEVITPDLQKIQFTASGDVLLDRQAGLRATRTGGYADLELVFDGKTMTVHNRHGKAFARLDVPGSPDEVVHRLRTVHFVELPGADLLAANAYERLTEEVLDAKHIGRGVVDGVECEHLAFRNPETDWQLWVETGERPVPRKYVITSKTVAQAPQYTLHIKELRTDVKSGPDAFAFTAPDGVKQVALDALGDIDEVPPGIPAGGSKP